MAIGLAIAPAAIYRAFVRGRRTRSLYDGEFREALLDEKVGTVRARLGLDRAPARTGADPMVFAAVSVVGVATLLASVLITLAPIAALVCLVAG